MKFWPNSTEKQLNLRKSEIEFSLHLEKLPTEQKNFNFEYKLNNTYVIRRLLLIVEDLNLFESPSFWIFFQHQIKGMQIHKEKKKSLKLKHFPYVLN